MEKPDRSAGAPEPKQPSAKKAWQAPRLITSGADIADTGSNLGLGSDGGSIGFQAS